MANNYFFVIKLTQTEDTQILSFPYRPVSLLKRLTRETNVAETESNLIKKPVNQAIIFCFLKRNLLYLLLHLSYSKDLSFKELVVHVLRSFQ